MGSSSESSISSTSAKDFCERGFCGVLDVGREYSCFLLLDGSFFAADFAVVLACFGFEFEVFLGGALHSFSDSGGFVEADFDPGPSIELPTEVVFVPC